MKKWVLGIAADLIIAALVVLAIWAVNYKLKLPTPQGVLNLEKSIL